MIVTNKLKIWRKVVSVYRCQTCGKLGLETQASLQSHQGHFMKQPCNVSLFEYIALTLGLIK